MIEVWFLASSPAQLFLRQNINRDSPPSNRPPWRRVKIGVWQGTRHDWALGQLSKISRMIMKDYIARVFILII